MLSPEYLRECTSYLLGMMDRINEQVTADIARRLVKTNLLTDTAAFQTELLLQQNKLFMDVKKDISKLSGLTEDEVAHIFREAHNTNLDTENLRAAAAGKSPIDHEANKAMGSLLSAHIRKTKGAVKNLTMTTALQAQSRFYLACNLAHMQVSTGAFTYANAIRNAIKQAADTGLTVQYPTGHVDKIDVAVRRAVLTGVNQSAAEINKMYCDEIGTDLVEVTAHTGARPTHAAWQGGVYSLHGKTKGYRLLADATGYGTGDGLCGWNCRHNFYAFYEGSPRTYTKEYLDNLDKETYEYGGVEYTNYEAGQKQRAYERQIRAEKRDLAALNAAYNETTDKALKDSLRLQMEPVAVKLKRTEAEMKRFCKATKRRVDTVRTQVHAVKDANGRIVGFDRSAAQRANKLYKNKNMGYNTRKGAAEKKYPRNYVSANEAVENALQRNSDRVYKKLLHGETTAIYEYSLTDYGITNRYLRNALLPDDDVVWNQTVERIRYLDSVLGKSTLNEDLLLYRGVDIAEFNDLAKGNTLTTYKSTSIKRDVAEHFGDYQIIIKAPAKTKGFYLGKYSDVKSEKEFLLHRNQKYRVLKIHNNVMEIEIYG